MSAFASVIVPEYAQIGFYGGLGLVALGVVGTMWAILHKGEEPMSEKPKEPTVGLDIQNSGGGVGADIQNSGPLGAESVVHVPAGQSAIGTRVVQNGPGIGMRVVQSGPGLGFRSTVIVGNNPEKDGKA